MMELKPCPFCGGEVEMHHGTYFFEIVCQCWRAGTEAYETEEEAAEAWNTRAERTCRLVPTRGVENYPTALVLDCSECGARFKYGFQPRPGEYCRGCGAKVVEE